MTVATILEEIPKLAEECAVERPDRQQRTEADPDDFQRLRELGVPLMAVPVEFGGTWENLCQAVFQTVLEEDAWWGTIISEPGSGGDISQTQSGAQPVHPPLEYRLSGENWALAFDQLYEMSWQES